MVTVISTFAGCGGSSLGYKMAGYKELLAIEWDRNAVETFKLNFPNIPVWQKDIKEVTGEEILEFCQIQKGELDLLDGSPPCQGFSTAGKRQVIDSRNELFQEFVRLIKGLQPRVFVMENVSGMVKGKMKGRFKEIILELKSTGYNVKCKKLNTMWYGVPQSRERLIFIGVRNALKIEPSYPEPLVVKPITVGEALKGCPYGDFTEPGSYREWSKRLKPGQAVQNIHPKGFGFNMRKLDINKPSYTVIKTHTPAAGLLHPIEDRFLSIPEVKRIMTFPDSFIFPISTTIFMTRQLAWILLGNSVPPKFMEAIAGHIKSTILGKQAERING